MQCIEEKSDLYKSQINGSLSWEVLRFIYLCSITAILMKKNSQMYEAILYSLWVVSFVPDQMSNFHPPKMVANIFTMCIVWEAWICFSLIYISCMRSCENQLEIDIFSKSVFTSCNENTFCGFNIVLKTVNLSIIIWYFDVSLLCSSVNWNRKRGRNVVRKARRAGR